MRFTVPHPNTKNTQSTAGSTVGQSQVCYLRSAHSSSLKKWSLTWFKLIPTWLNPMVFICNSSLSKKKSSYLGSTPKIKVRQLIFWHFCDWDIKSGIEDKMRRIPMNPAHEFPMNYNAYNTYTRDYGLQIGSQWDTSPSLATCTCSAC